MRPFNLLNKQRLRFLDKLEMTLVVSSWAKSKDLILC